MNFNWRVIVILVILFGTIIWGITSFIPLSYNGTDVEFDVGNGSVHITNLSDQPIPVELVSTGPASFTVSNPAADIEGFSVRQGSGRNITQSYVFELPAGVSEFTVVGGKDVKFLSNSDTRLEATVNPLSADEVRDRLILIVAVILGSLFILSSINDHRWISASRRQKARDKAAAQKESQETFTRMFGR